MDRSALQPTPASMRPSEVAPSGASRASYGLATQRGGLAPRSARSAAAQTILNAQPRTDPECRLA